MASSLFAAARHHLRRGLRVAGRIRCQVPSLHLPREPTAPHSSRRPERPLGLQSTLWPLGHPGTSLVPEIQRWAAKAGNRLRPVELQRVVRELRKRRRHRQALEVSEWMEEQGHVKFMPKDHAVQLDLIGEVRGLESAEAYFNGLPEKDKTDKTYGALLNCYSRELLVDKCLSHFQTMKELGVVVSALPYNNLMGLYTKTGQHEKVPSVMAEMKADGILPDNFSYRICINSYGRRADFFGMENILEEMEHQPQIVVDWNTYAVVASNYIKGNQEEKAVTALKKAERRIDVRDSDAYNHLISLYGQLGEKSEVRRLWELQMLNCRRHINKDYIAMLAVLVKLGEIEEAEALLKEWESSGNALDFQVPNVLLTGYRQKDLLHKAEALLNGFSKKGKMPPSTSWGIVAIGYAEKDDIGKAYELMKSALSVYVPNTGWKPNLEVIQKILKYLRDEGRFADVETFVNLLSVAMPAELDMVNATAAGGDGLKESETKELEEIETREITSSTN